MANGRPANSRSGRGVMWCEKTRASTVPLFETIAICSFGLSARNEAAASVASRRYFWIADSCPYAKKSRPAPCFLSSSLMAQGAEEGPSCEMGGPDLRAELRRRGGEGDPHGGRRAAARRSGAPAQLRRDGAQARRIRGALRGRSRRRTRSFRAARAGVKTFRVKQSSLWGRSAFRPRRGASGSSPWGGIGPKRSRRRAPRGLLRLVNERLFDGPSGS